MSSIFAGGIDGYGILYCNFSGVLSIGNDLSVKDKLMKLVKSGVALISSSAVRFNLSPYFFCLF